MKSNSNQLEVAVLIPTFNSARYLAESIESILNQSWENIVIYILDGGSSDCTLDIAKSYAKNNTINVRLYPNIHPCKRVDDCISELTSTYFAMQHADDISYKNRIETQVRAFKSDSELGVCSASYRSFWHDRMNKPSQVGEALHSKPIHHDEIKCQLIFWWVMHAPTLMFDREKALLQQLKFENKFKYINDYQQTVENINKLKYININEELSAYRLHFEGDGAKNVDNILHEELLLKEHILNHFGFKFSKKELETHLKIKLIPDGILNCKSIDEYNDVIIWLDSLKKQNSILKVFSADHFDNVINDLTIKTKNIISNLDKY